MKSLQPLRKLMEDALEQMLLEISPVLSNGAHHKAAKILYYDVEFALLEVHILPGSGVSIWRKELEHVTIESNRLERLANAAWKRYQTKLIEDYTAIIKKAQNP